MTMAAPNAPRVEPLNPLLYSLLEHRFGEVRIANEGVPAQVQSFQDPLNPRRKVKRGTWGEYYRISCPFCNDCDHKLWVNHTYGADVDTNTGRRTDTHLARCYKNACLDKPGKLEQFEDLVFGAHKRMMPKMVIRATTYEAGPKATDSAGVVVPLTELPDYHPAVEYLVGRGFDIKELTDAFEIGVCTEPSSVRYSLMRGRIYIPIYFNRQLVGWQGRVVGNTAYGSKYYNAPGTPKSQLLYNYDTAVKQPVVVVVEGVPSVWRLGAAAVCIFGKTMSAWQQMTVTTAWAGKPVFIMLDHDAQTELENTVHLLCQRGVNVVPVFLPDARDPADYSRPELLEILSSAASAVDVQADLSFLQ